MLKIKPIILWKDNKPALYCHHVVDNKWEVINGAWVLLLDDLIGVVERTKQIIHFDKVTEAPEINGDYNDIMAAAEMEEK